MSEYFEQYMNNLVPMVVEQTNRGERAYDIYEASETQHDSELVRGYSMYI